MIYRIEIGLKDGVPDARGRRVMTQTASALHIDLAQCRTRDVYKVDAGIDPAAGERIRAAFTDPVVAESAVDRLSPPEDFDWLIEVGFKPGVTDNVGRTARGAMQDALGRELAWREQVYTAVQYFLWGTLARKEAEAVGLDLLANPLIQTVQVFSRGEWARTAPDQSVPVFTEAPAPEVRTIDLSGSNADLERISREGILSLSLDEMHAIRDHYRSPEVGARREALGLPPWPTDVELECIAQTWSEHCSHKVFAGTVDYVDEETGATETIHSLYRSCIKASTRKIAERIDWLVSVFTDNAGMVKFNDRLHLAYKVETHNSPSALDPYGGAMTGIVGVNRDPMGTGLGCELLANVWGYCLASPFHAGSIPEGLMHPRRIRDGVHAGVIDGGNQSGIPWMRGFEVFDERYLGKPLVYCGTLGKTPVTVNGRPSEEKRILPGDLVVMAGGRIGKDGIHGATFSSEELRCESPAQAVQIGDPLTQRKLYEFLMEARDLGLYRCITDNGAGGISCSFGEMGKYSGGVECELADAPLKYEGLQPWEILLSEAQERMTLAVAPEQRAALEELARRRDVEVSFMGTFTASGAYVVKYQGRVVASMDMDFLYETGCPTLRIPARWRRPVVAEPRHPAAGDRTALLERMLTRLNICSREYKSRCYDGEVKGLSVVKPFVGMEADTPSDASVMRVEYGSHQGVVLAEGINPFFSDLDTHAMTESVVDEAVRRAISVGARPDRIALLDNFCWPDPVESEKTPDGAYKMAQLVRANKALYELTVAYATPLVSGKDSMKNDSTRGGRKISIPPTLLVSSLGLIDDVRKAVTMPLKAAGDAIYLAGITRDELGASEFHRMLAEESGTPDAFGGTPPGVEAESAMRLYRAVHAAIDRELLHASHTPTKGGLAVALALSCIGGGLGAAIDLAEIPVEGNLGDDQRLFSESNSRFLLTCAPQDTAALEALFADIPLARIGTVTAEPRLRVDGAAGRVIDADIEVLRLAFKATLHGV